MIEGNILYGSVTNITWL